ncbi:MAG: ABC transporter permease [Eubacteriaceae bacterium]
MIKLIKLELRKNKISTYLWATLWIFIGLLGLCFMFGFIPRLESVDGVVPADIKIMQQWENFIAFVSILTAMSFSILSAVMHTKFTVEEYTGKSAALLFSYPESRSKILFAKCSLVFCFTAVFSLISNLIAVSIFGFFSNVFGIMPEIFSLFLLPKLLSVSGVCSLLAAAIGLIAMRIGFWKKSIVATVVAAVIMVAPFGNIISIVPQYSGIIHLVGMLVLLFIGLLIVTGLMSKVNKMEAL